MQSAATRAAGPVLFALALCSLTPALPAAERPAKPVPTPAALARDIDAAIDRALARALDHLYLAVLARKPDERPIAITNKGKPVAELFA
jgi:hypothetical protein